MMEQEKTNRLLFRQLTDIQVQADKILSGDASPESIESFAKYSNELKSYMLANINSDNIRYHLEELPDINYSRNELRLWQYLLLPSWWISWFKDYKAKKRTIEEIYEIKGKYATLEFLVKGMIE